MFGSPKAKAGSPRPRSANGDDDDDVTISLELPQGKVEAFLKQLEQDPSALKQTFPLAHTASVEAVVPPSGRRVDDIIPQAKVAFDPVERLARLRNLQERYSVVSEHRDKANAAKKIMSLMPVAGEQTTVAPPPAPHDSVGATFAAGAPADVPPPFPPPGGLPFPYAGVPGVLEPRAKAPPDPEPDIAKGDHWMDDDQALQNDHANSNRLPKSDLLFLKDGLDMSLQQLKTHGQRMSNDVREMSRKLDEAVVYAEVKQLRTQPEVMDEFMRQQRIIYEQQRKVDESNYDVKLEQERQFWVERDARQRRLRKAYGDQFQGGPEGDPPQQLQSINPLRRQDGLADLAEIKETTSASSTRRFPAMEYVLPPDAPTNNAPPSYYEDELMPSQAYRQNLIQEAAAKNWPPAPTYNPYRDEEEEPEGEAVTGTPARGGAHRRARKRDVAPGIVIGGARGSVAVQDRAANAPVSEVAFMTGWREGDPVPFGAFAGERELPEPAGTERSSGSKVRNSTAGEAGGSSASNTAAPNARSSVTDLLMMPFAAFGGYSEVPASSDVLQEQRCSKASGEHQRGKGQSHRTNAAAHSNRSQTPPARRNLRFGAVQQPMSDVSGSQKQQSIVAEERSKKMRSASEPPFCAFAGEDEGGRTKRRLKTTKRIPNRTAADLRKQSDELPAGGWFGELFATEPEIQDENVRPAGFDSDSEAASDIGVLGAMAEAVGLGGDGPLTLAEVGLPGGETPWDREQRVHEVDHVDPSDIYMSGACTERAPPLVPPDHVLLDSRGYAAVNMTLQEVMALRRAGKLGDRLSAQAVLNYVYVVAKSAKDVAEAGQVSHHVSMQVDILSFYPVAVQIHLWAIEALVVLYRADDHNNQESLSGPIFDAMTQLMKTHLRDPSLHDSTPELPKRILAALALVLTPATSPRLKLEHVDFTIGVVRSTGVGPSLMEHGLQLLLVARIAHRIREQAMIARAALRSFKAEPRLVTRAFLALGVAFEIATEAAQPDPEPEEGDEGDITEEALLRDTGLEHYNTVKNTEMSGVKKRIWEQRLMDQAGHAHKALVERAPALASQLHVQGQSRIRGDDRHLVPVGLRDIVTGMDLYAQDRKVQGAAAVALAAAVMLPYVSYPAMKGEGVIRALILAQQHFSNSRSIALHLCQVLVQFARRDNTLLSVEVVVTALNAGNAFPRDAEVSVTAIQVVHAFVQRLHELCPDRGSRLSQMAGDLVRLGEGRHTNPHALAMLLVIFVAAASDGQGTAPGGAAGEQWRAALATAAAVVVPLRVLYEHLDDIDLVLSAAIALRILTYGNNASAAHVARLRGVEALLGTIQKHHHRPDMARELLSALANVGAAPAARELFSSKLPDAAEAIYNAIEKSGATEPDVLAQGCRALGALTAGPKQDSNRFAIDKNRIDRAVARTSEGISYRLGLIEDTSGGGYLEIFTGTAEATNERRGKLKAICYQLIDCVVASGPQFGRLVGNNGEMIAEVHPRRHLARSKTPQSRRASQ